MPKPAKGSPEVREGPGRRGKNPRAMPVTISSTTPRIPIEGVAPHPASDLPILTRITAVEVPCREFPPQVAWC